MIKSNTVARPQRTKGFTLIEVMITVVIVGILASVAYPSYIEHVRKSRRADAKAALVAAAQTMERYYTEKNTYVGATAAASGGTIPNWAPADRPSSEATYTISLPNAQLSATSFTVVATRTGKQTSDTSCGDFTLTNTGLKGMQNGGTVAQCW